MKKLFTTSGYKNNIILLLSGLAVSFLAWLFWRYTGEYGLEIVATIFFILILIENYTLKKRVKNLEDSIK